MFNFGEQLVYYYHVLCLHLLFSHGRQSEYIALVTFSLYPCVYQFGLNSKQKKTGKNNFGSI